MPRFISMKHFRDTKVAREVEDTNTPKAVGQVIGHVTAIVERDGVLPSGEAKKSYCAMGEFEAIVYRTGQVLQSGQIFLPDYYAKEIAAALGTGATTGGNLLFGVEVSYVPTGHPTIKTAWEITNITGMARSRPLEALKRHMAKAGVLKLPAPSGDPLPGEDAPFVPNVELPAPQTAAQRMIAEANAGHPPAPEPPAEWSKLPTSETLDADGEPLTEEELEEVKAVEEAPRKRAGGRRASR